jgi:peroxiredoxin
MSHPSHRPTQARPAAAPAAAARRTRQLIVGALVVAGVVVLLAASFAVNRGSAPVGHAANHMAGTYAAVGSRAPAFTGTNVITGKTVTSAQLSGKKVLYYFSEGSGCQACMVQAQSLEQESAALHAQNITLVSVTNDSPSILRQAASAYRLKGTFVADPERTLTTRFGALGGGMHADTADHTFILVDQAGIVRFHQDYPNMWVEPADLLSTLSRAS